jgi:hypothetical protein
VETGFEPASAGGPSKPDQNSASFRNLYCNLLMNDLERFINGSTAVLRASPPGAPGARSFPGPIRLS